MRKIFFKELLFNSLIINEILLIINTVINSLNVGACGIEPPADIFRLKWLRSLL